MGEGEHGGGRGSEGWERLGEAGRGWERLVGGVVEGGRRVVGEVGESVWERECGVWERVCSVWEKVGEGGRRWEKVGEGGRGW